MRAIKSYGDNYFAFKISEIGIKKFHALIKEAVLHSNKLSTDAVLEIQEAPVYVTQIPYNSGFIEERVVYYITLDLSNYILEETDKDEGVELFFSKNFCWDFYSETTLILSINMVQNIVTVNSMAIELMDFYEYEEEI